MTSGSWTTQLGKTQRRLLAYIQRFPGESSSFYEGAGFRRYVRRRLAERGFIEDDGSEDLRSWVLTPKGEEALIPQA